MTRKPFALIVGIIAAGMLPAAPAAAQPASTALTGLVGSGFTIRLMQGGGKVRSLKPGSYRITVADRASVHDFHLFGPGVNKLITSVRFTGTRTVTVTLRSGTYTYQCDPHAAGGMRATFTVAAPAPPATTTETAPATTTTTVNRGYGY
jgi:copper binding plastocyanin/azurin family protein